MFNGTEVDITSDGAVILGPDVVCDGFVYGKDFRVQSHIHKDHMDNFETSKGQQSIIMSPESYQLLKLIKNADIPYRSNIKPTDYGKTVTVGSSEVVLYSSGHILGAVQTQVTLSDGIKVGYSGDFSWPLENVIKTDILVVDSTYGKPNYVRKYKQEDVHSAFTDLVISKRKERPIKIKARRGTLQRSLDILNTADLGIPVLADNAMFKETQLYREFGFNIPLLYHIDSKEGKEIRKSDTYIYVCNPETDNPTLKDSKFITILLSNCLNSKEPIVEYSSSSYQVGFSDHADFEDTMKYIEKTGAKMVITDNVRGPHAVDLALEIRARLNIDAFPSGNKIRNEWSNF